MIRQLTAPSTGANGMARLGQWREPQCRFQMIRREVRIAHRHRDRRVPQDPLQSQDVATSHHVMTSERVPQDVGHLARRIESAAFVRSPKCRTAGHEQPIVSRHAQLQCQRLDVLRYRYGSGLAVFGPVKVRLAAIHRRPSERFGFVPAGTGSQAEQGDGVGVIVGGALALVEQLADLRQGEEGQLYLIGLDLAD